MLVSELIDILKEYNDDLPVCITVVNDVGYRVYREVAFVDKRTLAVFEKGVVHKEVVYLWE